MEPHPVRLELGGDLQRSRLTVFFRLLLAIPHFIWIVLWGIAIFFAVIVNWFATLITGRSPDGLHRFIGAYIRYWTHLFSYLYLAANPYPEFTGSHGDYPVDLAIDPPEPQALERAASRRHAVDKVEIEERSRIQQQVGDLIERQPEDVAQLLRSWLADRRS